MWSHSMKFSSQLLPIIVPIQLQVVGTCCKVWYKLRLHARQLYVYTFCKANFNLKFKQNNIMIVAKMTAVVLLATLAAFLSLVAASNFEEKSQGLVVKELSAEKVEGEYHGETGNIQFSSIV